MIVWAVADLTRAWPFGKWIRVGLASAALCGCVVMTSLQIRYWRTSITLLEHAVRVAGNNFLVHVMLGNVWSEQGRLDAALEEYKLALRLQPDDPQAWQRAGAVITQQGKPADAIPYLDKAIQLAPSWPAPRRQLGLAFLSQGRQEEARVAYQSLLPLLPPTAEGQRDLADMLAEGQQTGEAISRYREALRLKPDFLLVLNNLGWLRATAAQSQWRDGKEAVQLAERACMLSHRRNPNCLGVLAAAYAEVGRFSEAVKTLQEAQGLAKASGADYLLPLHRRMMAQFQAGKPFHEGEP